MSQMIEVKTAELSDGALDWATAVAAGKSRPMAGLGGRYCVVADGHTLHRFNPSSEWAHGGPLLDEYAIEFEFVTDAVVRAFTHIDSVAGFGRNHLIAACRAIVAAKLGGTVAVPTELLP